MISLVRSYRIGFSTTAVRCMGTDRSVYIPCIQRIIKQSSFRYLLGHPDVTYGYKSDMRDGKGLLGITQSLLLFNSNGRITLAHDP